MILATIVLVGCLVLLSMYMVDRQWRTMSRMQSTFTEQAKDLREIRKTVRELQLQVKSGVVINDHKSASVEQFSSKAFSRAIAVSQQADYSQGDWFVQAFPVGLKTITPLVSADVYAATVQSYVIESLLIRNPDTLEWDGLLAESWQVSEDGLTIDFKLRDNLVFSDGKPLTATDVAFSYQFVMDERIAAPRVRSNLKKIASVEALGKHRVRFIFAEPYFESLGLAGQMEVLAQHFYAPYLNDTETFNQSKGILFGSGPYQLPDPKAWTPDSGRVELIRNQRYWGTVQPSYDRLIWSVIENDSARLAAFRNGTIDGYASKPREFNKLLNDEQLKQSARHLEYMSPTAGYSFIGWNSERDGNATVFADTKVRRAMTYLTDRQRIIDEIMLGYAEIAVSPFNPRSQQHNPAISPWKADVTAARQLLAEAGFEDRNGDGVLEDTDGQQLEFELVYYQESDDTRRIVLFLKDLYAKAGVVLVPKPSEWSVMIDLLDSRNFDAITLGWSSGVEIDINQMFHSNQIDGGGDNFINFKSDNLDRLIDEARATVDEKKRMPLWWQAEEILHNEQPYTFLMRKKSLMFLDKRIKNVEVTKLGLNITQVPVENYVPENLQKHSQ